MESEGLPPGGGGKSVIRTLPSWMDPEGDRITTKTLLLRAVNGINHNASSQTSTSSPPSSPEVTLPADPFLINKSIDLALNCVSRKIVTATKEARGTRYVLRTSSKSAFDKLCTVTQLIDGTPIEIIPHPMLNCSQGVVYDADTIDLDTNTLLEYLRDQQVTNVRRITRRIGETIKNTPLVVLTFSESTLPAHIYYGLVRLPVRRYYPSPLLCFGCAKYGHSRKFCNLPPICHNCSTTHETENNHPCLLPKFCCNCKGKHGPFDRQCPVYLDETAIIRLKTDRNMTFGEARAEFNSRKRQSTYANQTQVARSAALGDSDEQVKALREELARKNEELTEMITLKEEVTKLQAQLANANDYKNEIIAMRAELKKYREAYKMASKELLTLKTQISANTANATKLTMQTSSQPQPKKLKVKSGDVNYDDAGNSSSQLNPTSSQIDQLSDQPIMPAYRSSRERNKSGLSNTSMHNTRSRSNNSPITRPNSNNRTVMDIDDSVISD